MGIKFRLSGLSHQCLAEHQVLDLSVLGFKALCFTQEKLLSLNFQCSTYHAFFYSWMLHLLTFTLPPLLCICTLSLRIWHTFFVCFVSHRYGKYKPLTEPAKWWILLKRFYMSLGFRISQPYVLRMQSFQQRVAGFWKKQLWCTFFEPWSSLSTWSLLMFIEWSIHASF